MTFIENKIIEIKRDFERNDELVTAQKVVDAFLENSNTANIPLIKFMDGVVAQICNLNKQYSEGTQKNYRTTLKYVTDYLKRSKLDDIRLKQFGLREIEAFHTHMMNRINPILGKSLSRNGANKHHERLRAIFNKAYQQELIESNPYARFKLKHDKVHKVFLTTEELELIENHSLGGNESLPRVRDVFMFSVYTGLRYKDALELKEKDVVKDKKGQFWITIKQEKTNEFLRVPMMDRAKKIYQKYSGLRVLTKKVLPPMANQRVNTNLKVIAELTGITKNLTHHVARHTFATTITLSNNMPIEIVSKMLGHSSLRSTQIYAKITNDYLAEHIDQLNQKLK